MKSLANKSVVDGSSLDRTLVEIRSSRRLEKIVASIEGFLSGQITRLDKSLDQIKLVADNDKILQRVLADFENEKKAWEDQRQAEMQRLQMAGDKLIDGWKQLESERRKWLDQDRPAN